MTIVRERRNKDYVLVSTFSYEQDMLQHLIHPVSTFSTVSHLAKASGVARPNYPRTTARNSPEIRVNANFYG